MSIAAVFIFQQILPTVLCPRSATVNEAQGTALSSGGEALLGKQNNNNFLLEKTSFSTLMR